MERAMSVRSSMGSGRVRAVAVLVVMSGFAACGGPPPLDETQVKDWVDILYPLPKAERLSPPVSARMISYAGLAMYEALRHSEPGAQSLSASVQGLAPIPEPGEGEHDWSVVAAAAERSVLSGMLEAYALPSTMVQIDTIFEAQIERRRALGVSEETIDRSLAYAEQISAVILEREATDGFMATRPLTYDLPRGEGIWINTTTLEEYAPISASEASQFVRRNNPSAALIPGASNARRTLLDRPSGAGEILPDIDPTEPLEPHWGQLLPWGMTDLATCRPPAPHPYSTDPESPFWAEVMTVYETSMTLTAEQRDIANFWADNPGATGTPPGHWVAIMRQMIVQLDLTPFEAARMFAVTSMALNDAFISAWDEKYKEMGVRPVSFIREHVNPEWETVVVTPPFPEYTSGHSVASGAASTVLTALLGAVPYMDSTHVANGFAPRPYADFDEAAKEASQSRIYGGIHYPMAADNGLAQGQCVARQLLDRTGISAGAGSNRIAGAN